MHERCVCTVNDDTLCHLIEKAKQRVVFVSPGTSLRVAKVLADTWRSIGSHAVSIVLDVDPDVCRLGYGEDKAIEFLQQTANELSQSLCEQPGVRIGLLIVDDKTLVYSPTFNQAAAKARALRSQLRGKAKK